MLEINAGSFIGNRQQNHTGFMPKGDMALEIAFDEALRAFNKLSDKGNVELKPSTMNSDERFHPKIEGLPRNTQAGELAKARTQYTPRVPITPWQEDGMSPNNQKNHRDSCAPQEAELYFACAQSGVSEGPLLHASPGGLATSKAGPSNKGSITRTHSEMASSIDIPSEARKHEHQEDVSFPLIDPTNVPPDTIDRTRPRYRYATLIGMAILRAQKRCLTLAQIYKWISDNFAFYSLAKSGWQNSIRHSLTLNKNFIKIERSKDDPGKGSYWGIEPGQEHNFVKDEQDARCSMMSRRALQYIHTTTHVVDRSFRVTTSPAIEKSTEAPGLSEKTSSGQEHPEIVQSPDDRIAVVDSDVEELGMDTAAVLPALIPSRSPRCLQKRRSRLATPPYTLVHCSNATPGNCWPENDDTLNGGDFGWLNEPPIKYIEPCRLVLKQAAGRSRFRAGRAEAEIARIRSSHTTSLEYYGRTQSCRSLSSHQRTNADSSTPVVVFEAPILAFPSRSPETNLRTHRKNTWALLGSPTSPRFSLSSSSPP